MSLLAALASDATLDTAFAWLCKRRRDYPDHAEVWDFRRHWPAEKARLQLDLSAGRFRFGLLDRITQPTGRVLARRPVWDDQTLPQSIVREFIEIVMTNTSDSDTLKK